ncbi:MAG TPA: hypothetical protein VGF23_22110 [Gaiellaceae bacterium]
MADPVIRRDELDAAIKARRELGDEYEPEVVDAFIERVEKRIEKQLKGARPAKRQSEARGSITPLALGSIALGIPITAVALSNSPGGGGIVVAIIAWLAIALINIAAAFRR